jgi:deoxyribose-phosphate aldolase
MSADMEKDNILGYVECTLLKPDAGTDAFKQLIEDTLQCGGVGICVPPNRVSLCRDLLEENPLEIITVISFPYGYDDITTKAEGIKRALALGARHVDVVCPLGWIREAGWDKVKREFTDLTQVAHNDEGVIKWILETGMWDEVTIKKLCDLALEAGADYVKTSTGINTGGATPEMIRLIKKHVGDKIHIKASGGIKTWEQAAACIQAGAARIGASSLCHKQ